MAVGVISHLHNPNFAQVRELAVAAENAGAGDLQLTEAELARIHEAFPTGPSPRELPVL